MSNLRSKEWVPKIGVSSVPEGLLNILNSEYSAAIWQRSPLPTFQSWIDELDINQLPKARLILPINGVRGALKQVCEICGTPNCQEREMLVDDTAALATIFAEIVSTSHIQLSLEVSSEETDQVVHSDSVTSRLVCTYRGEGPQIGIESNTSMTEFRSSIATGSVMLLRGALWPHESKSPVICQSTPTKEKGDARLLLVLDPVLDADKRNFEYALH